MLFRDKSGQLAEGFQWVSALLAWISADALISILQALYMHNAFVNSDTSGYLHWWCAQNTTGDNALIRLQYDDYFVSARLWAFASYFRFARPGSIRVDAQSSAPDEVFVSAYVNKNGSIAIPVVNAAHFPYDLEIDLFGDEFQSVTAYLTNNEHNVTMMGQKVMNGSTFSARIEPRSMKTYFLQ